MQIFLVLKFQKCIYEECVRHFCKKIGTAMVVPTEPLVSGTGQYFEPVFTTHVA